MGDQDKKWAPHICCATCVRKLTQWLSGGSRSHMPFAVPMIWREPKDHITDCYFCLTKISGFSSKNRNGIIYPNLDSAIRPVPHSESLPVPTRLPGDEVDEDENNTTGDSSENMQMDPAYEGPSAEPHLITQPELNDLVRDLGLSKNQSELLGSRLQGWNLLQASTNVTVYRNRDKEFAKYFTLDNELAYCNDVD